MGNRIKTILQALILMILFSLGTILAKMALAGISPFTFSWVSIGIGLIVLSFYTFIIRKERIPKKLGKRIWLMIIALGVCNFLLAKVIRSFALNSLPAITTTYLGNFVGFVTMAMSSIMLKEYPSLSQLIGAIIAILGINLYFDEPLQSGELIGIILISINILLIAFTNNVSRKLATIKSENLSTNIIATTSLLIGGSGVVLAGLIFDFPPEIPDIKSWGILLYSGVANITLGVVVWNHILRTMRSYEASILGASTIIFTALLAMLMLQEFPSTSQWLGMGTMFLGLILVQVRKGNLATIFKKKGVEEPGLDANET
jgi:drug/metabolite transporter (DMT)-like permease